MYQHIRITYNPDNPNYCTWVQSKSTEHIIAKEAEDDECKQPHIHIHGYFHFKNQQAFRDKFVGRTKGDKFDAGAFPELHGSNGRYSIRAKLCDRLGYRYVCKGTGPNWDTDKPKILSTSFTEDEIKGFHSAYWAHCQPKPPPEPVIVDMAALDEQTTKPKRKTRALTFMEKIVKELKEECPDKKWNRHLETDRIILVKYLYRKMGSAVKKINKRIFCDMFNGLYAALPKDIETERLEINYYLNAVENDQY